MTNVFFSSNLILKRGGVSHCIFQGKLKFSRERGAEGGPNAYSYSNLKHLNFPGWGGGWEGDPPVNSIAILNDNLLINMDPASDSEVHDLDQYLTLVLLNLNISSLENSVDPDQIASSEAMKSGSALFFKQPKNPLCQMKSCN